MKVSYCPECDQRLKLGSHVYQSQRIRCSGCEAQLVVIQVNPIELELASYGHIASGSKKKVHTSQEAVCPACEGIIHLSNQVRLGQQVNCRACKTTLEIVDVDPLDVEVAVPISWKRTWGQEIAWSQPNRDNRINSYSR